MDTKQMFEDWKHQMMGLGIETAKELFYLSRDIQLTKNFNDGKTVDEMVEIAFEKVTS